MILKRAYFISVFLTALLVCHSIAGTGSEKTYIALSNITRQGIDESAAAIITDRLRSELFKTGAFRVLEREQMDEILEEQEFQQSDCVSDACLVEVGQLLGVTHMVTGSLGKLGKIYTINLRMIDVETGEVVYTRDTDCQCPIEEVLSQSTVDIARKMATFMKKGADDSPVSGSGTVPEAEATQKKEKPPGKKKSSLKYWIIGGAVVAAAAGTASWYLISSSEKKEKEKIYHVPRTQGGGE
jgi:TolB-like protein